MWDLSASHFEIQRFEFLRTERNPDIGAWDFENVALKGIGIIVTLEQVWSFQIASGDVQPLRHEAEHAVHFSFHCTTS